MNTMTRCPTHPGEILREDSLPALGLSVTAFARGLGVSRQMAHGLLAERSAVSPEMAVRLGAFFGNGPQLWIDMQTRRDLWLAEQKMIGHLPKPYESRNLNI
jgi:addiction module HigA family antidote